MAVFAIAPMVAAVSVGEISIPISTIVQSPEGSETILASVDVEAEFVGKLCEVQARSENQGSVHFGNDLVVQSGVSKVTLKDVEGVSDGVVTADGYLDLGTRIVVTLIMGPDRVFSAGVTVVVDCEPEVIPPPVTTTTVEVVPTDVTTTVPDEVLQTVVTTTVPDEVLDTVVTPPTTVSDEVLDTVVTPPTTVPEILPFTGSESEELALIALALVGTGVLFLVATRSRRED